KKLEVSDRWLKLKDGTWHNLFQDAAKKYSEKEAIVFRDQRMTFGELLGKATELAKGLYDIGVRPKDHVALWMSNRPEWVVCRYGINMLGAVMIPLNTRYKAEELEYVLSQSDARVLLMEDKFFGRIDAMGILRGLCPELDNAKSKIPSLTRFPLLRGIICLGDSNNGCFTWDEAFQSGKKIADSDIKFELQNDDLIHIIYTSGTTGFPKGVMIANSNFISVICINAELDRFEQGDRFLVSLPLFGNIGLVTHSQTLFQGATTVLTDRYDVNSTLEILDREKITHTVFIPTMLVDILAHPDLDKYDLSSMKNAAVGGAYCPASLIREVKEKLGWNLTGGYGLVEASGLSTMVPVGDTPEHIEKTVGLPMPHCELTIRDPVTSEEYPIGREGEICTRETYPGSQFMKGYYKKPELTAQTIKGEWLHSGDLGMMNADGYVRITGRVKEMFIVGGFNVSPPEIEEFLLKHPRVEEVAVLGVPDKRLGEVGSAFIRLRKGQKASPEEIIGFCKDKIADIKVPRYVFFVEEFPLTPQMKIQKFKLKELAVRELGLDETKQE
ncbi:MAG: AMP-binding protein, partial [Thermodesulfobacteriota bacterium]|nr:AMP-binding protein [Thermodesulfobacteriota bacterium]